MKSANIISTPKVNMNVLSMIGFSEYDINKENHIDNKNAALGDQFVVTVFDDKPLQFDIGSLSDITFLGNIKDFPTLRIAPGQ